MPKLTKSIKAVPPGEVYPRTFEAGEEVEGRVAEIAEQLGALHKAPPKTKAMKPPENK
jgi:hypothetical protein